MRQRSRCTICRQRRVKCDGNKPCSNCHRRAEVCEYEPTSDVPSPVSASRARNHSVPNGSVSPDPSTSLSVVGLSQHWHREMYLMHHYSVSTAMSITHDTRLQHILQSMLPAQIPEYPFLVHAIVAIAALHVAYLREDKSQWVSLALRHQSLLSAQMRDLLPKISDANCGAIFMALWLLCGSSLAFASISTNPEALSLGDVVSPITHIRGGLGMQSSKPCWQPPPEMTHFLNHAKYDEPIVLEPLPISIQDNFQRLRGMLANRYVDEVYDILVDALDLLEDIYKRVLAFKKSATHVDIEIAWKWAWLVSQSYVLLLREGHQGALVIFAHFALLSKSKELWSVDGYAIAVVIRVSKELDDYWKPAMMWPERQIKTGFAFLKGED